MATITAENITKNVQQLDKYQAYFPYLLPVGAGLVGLAIIFALLIPSINDDIDKKATSDANGSKAAAMDLKISQLQNLDQAKLTANLSKAEAALPSDKEIAGLLANINSDAASSNVSIAAASLTPNAASAASATGSAPIQFSISISGDFNSTKTFLTKVETTRRVITVKSFSISAGSGSTLTSDLIIETYYLPAPNVTPGSDVALPFQTPTEDKILADLDKRTNFLPPISTPVSGGRVDPFASF